MCNVDAMYMEFTLKFTYLWEHAVLFTLSGGIPECVRGKCLLSWVLDRIGICIAASLNFLYKVSLYVCLSDIMCGEVPQALNVVV
jgi:hypothetical protein